MSERDLPEQLSKPHVLLELELCNSSFYNLRKKRLLTQPIKVGVRLMWPRAEISAIKRARSHGMPDARIRELVERLEAERESHWPSIKELAAPARASAVRAKA